jgi:hypothetical protein
MEEEYFTYRRIWLVPFQPSKSLYKNFNFREMSEMTNANLDSPTPSLKKII